MARRLQLQVQYVASRLEGEVNTYLDCIPCFLRQGLDAARNITEDARIHEQIVRDVLRLTADLDLDRPPPWVGQIIHRRLRELTGVDDPYRAAKERFNRLAISMLPKLRDQVKRDPHPLVAAVKAAIAANVIDLGVKSSLGEDEAREVLRESGTAEIVGDVTEFLSQVDEAREILYLADNAGEIVVDRLLIEELGPERVTLVVRGKPVINDATIDDARAAGLHELVRIIDNGSDAPGTILDDCSAELRERFHAADVIVAKGQGNFETLSEIDASIFFLLKVKCPVIARHVGLPRGTHALVSSRSKVSPRVGANWSKR
jgi:damage-control phosphatase, subfamily I